MSPDNLPARISEPHGYYGATGWFGMNDPGADVCLRHPPNSIGSVLIVAE